MMKKNSIKFILGAGFILLTSSCSNFLNQPVQGEDVDTPAYYNDVTNANMAVTACYNALQLDDKSSVYQWNFGDLLSDDALKGGGSQNESVYIVNMINWKTLPTNIAPTNEWTASYTAIFRANTVIERLQDVTFDPNLKKQYIAQAKFVRAYSYLNLVKLFGDVPLLTKTLTPADVKSTTRAPYADVLIQVEKDFNDAAAVLPATWSVDQLGRATSGAARALEARTLMYAIGTFKTEPASTWQKVYNLTDTIVKSGAYSLLPNYAKIFENEGENNSGSVFEIQYKSTGTVNDWTSNNAGTNSPIVVENRGTQDHPNWGWGYDCPTNSLVNEFEPNDPRLYCTVMGNGITDYVYGERQYVPTDPTFLSGYVTRKMQTDPALRGPNQSNYPNNNRIMRYADVLLMKAEAAYHLGKEDVARQCINMVRARARQSTFPKGYTAGSNNYTSTGFSNNLPDVTATGTALLAAIKHERRVELAQEALRYYDLVRWGDYRATLAPSVQANYDSHLLRGVPVLPIPSQEVVAWGLTQNPGY